MFFTSEPTLPFSTVEEVMKLYPSFKLLMMNGNDVHFQYKALAVSQESKISFYIQDDQNVEKESALEFLGLEQLYMFNLDKSKHNLIFAG